MSENNTSFFNDGCPVCLCVFENDVSVPVGSIHITSCMHKIHLKCAENLISFNCQICNQRVNNYPSHIISKILDHKKQYEDKLEKEDFQELQRLEALRRERERIALTNQYGEAILEGPIKREIMMAMQVLKSIGIPLRYIPIEINVIIYKNQPRTPPSLIFQQVLSSIINKACKDIEDYNPDNDENEDDTHCFDIENMLYSSLNRGIDIKSAD